ncbi:MAG: squalene synthase HpnC [Bacteroidota bacterium]
MSSELINLAKVHYENFPVGSFFLKKNIKEPIQLIYTFARVADDFADEGDFTIEERISKLNNWEKEFTIALNGTSSIEIMNKLSVCIEQFKLTKQYFYDLIEAFKMDANEIRFINYDELNYYCRHSANPIGRLLLEINESNNEENNILSDKICTALQIINFIQDVKNDSRKNRCYMPMDLMNRHKCNETDLLEVKNESAKLVLKELLTDSNKLLKDGSALLKKVNKSFRLELKLIFYSGNEIANKLEKQLLNSNFNRPKINLIDKIKIGAKTVSSYL